MTVECYPNKEAEIPVQDVLQQLEILIKAEVNGTWKDVPRSVANVDAAILAEAAEAIAKCNTLEELFALEASSKYAQWWADTSDSGYSTFRALFDNAEIGLTAYLY